MPALQFYVGPFARVPGVLKAAIRTVPQCSAACGEVPAAASKFCASCGAPVNAVTTQAKQGVRLYSSDLPDGFVDQLSSPEYCQGAAPLESIWMPNRRGVGRRIDDVTTMSLAQVEQGDEVNQFIDQYGEVLRYVEKTYGVTTVIDWGVVAYYY